MGRWTSGNLLAITKDDRNPKFSYLIVHTFSCGTTYTFVLTPSQDIPLITFTLIAHVLHICPFHHTWFTLFFLAAARTDSIGALLIQQ